MSQMRGKIAMTRLDTKAHVFVPAAVGSNVCRTCLRVESNEVHLAGAMDQFDREPEILGRGAFLTEPTGDSDLTGVSGEEDWTGRDD